MKLPWVALWKTERNCNFSRFDKEREKTKLSQQPNIGKCKLRLQTAVKYGGKKGKNEKDDFFYIACNSYSVRRVYGGKFLLAISAAACHCRHDSAYRCNRCHTCYRQR